METYLALLPFAVPGFITQKINELLNYDTKETNQFNSSIFALVWSVLIISINYFIVTTFWMGNFKVVDDIKNVFLSIPFVVAYAKLTIMVSVVIAIIWDSINPCVRFISNKYRIFKGRNRLLGTKSVWGSCFNDGRTHRKFMVQTVKRNLALDKCQHKKPRAILNY